MSVSNDDIRDFYQEPLFYMWKEHADCMYFLVGWPENRHDVKWYTKALAALTRMELSGLITSENETKDVLTALSNTTDDNVWLSYSFGLTPVGKKFIERFPFLETDNDFQEIIPGFREALSRVFDEHGVGFGVELPYKMSATPS